MPNTAPKAVLDLLDQNDASYEKLTHEPLGFTSSEVAQARGVELGQCAKAVVLKLKGGGVKRHVLAVLPGDRRIDIERLAGAFNARRASFASAEEVESLTGSVPGALAPFSFNPNLALVVDPSLFARFAQIAFNAGTLTETIVLDVADYRRIVAPREVAFVDEARADPGKITRVVHNGLNL